jgi:hypothetical protein
LPHRREGRKLVPMAADITPEKPLACPVFVDPRPRRDE